jgi:hypothetical protein
MSFPSPNKFNLVVAATNAAGEVDFLDVTPGHHGRSGRR